jgi:pimeloyl-ACP methyl ester carboxylesterase
MSLGRFSPFFCSSNRPFNVLPSRFIGINTIKHRRKSTTSTYNNGRGRTRPLCCLASQTAPALVWFKRDLRLDDHPGLCNVVEQGNQVVPVFVFDPEIYSSVVDCEEMAYALADAVVSLQTSLRERGLDVVVLCGSWKDVIPRCVDRICSLYEDDDSMDCGCVVVTERECDDVRWAQGVENVRRGVCGRDDVEFEMWDCMIHGDYSEDSYPEWVSTRNTSYTEPLDKDMVQGIVVAHGAVESLQQDIPAASAFSGEYVWNEISRVSSSSKKNATVALIENTSYPVGVCSNESRSLQCLQEYMNHGTTECWSEMDAAIKAFDTDATLNGCFPAIFTRALYATGTLSRRRVYHEAIKYLESQGECAPFDEEPLFRGPLSWLGWMLTSSGGDAARAARVRKAKAALAAVELNDFHLGMAYTRQGQSVFGATLEHFRWRGVLTDYLVALSSSGQSDKPAIVLVHGFGAFGEHWRRNVRELADSGFDVYAPTFPGYGRSEKMSLEYGQDLWRDFLADFISEIIKRPVVLAGNSIGGYISASVAADYPGLVKGLVLLNSAGQINPSFSIDTYEREKAEKPKRPPPSIVVNGISTLLFTFLEADIENQLQRLYPTRPENADAWLGREIRRASKDPQALGVFRSVFYLPSPRPLNYLINELYRGPVLVLQGALDPLNDATSRARQITHACPTAECVLLQAGHCPHDEVPDLVNAEIRSFTTSIST